MVSRYVTNGPVNVKDGICLLPPTHYRMIPPQRADSFHVPGAGQYVPQQQPQQQQPQQQQQNQQGNPQQQQTLRSIQQTGPPPNQASTPPTDLKVQSVPQQQAVYLTSQPRGNQQHFYRQPGPPSQTARMPNQQRGQQPMFQPQAGPHYIMQVPPVYLNMYPYNGQRPQTFVQPAPVSVFGGQNVQPQFPYQANPNQMTYQYYQVPRQGHPAQTVTVAQNSTPQLQNIQMTAAAVPQQPQFQQKQPQPQQQQQQHQRKQNQRRAHAIAIIDPTTGVDRLDEVFEQTNNSHPPSGESSARQTPQPAAANSHNKEVQATFAKQVAQAINDEEPAGGTSSGGPPAHLNDVIDSAVYHHHNQQPQQQPPPHMMHNINIIPPNTNRFDHIVQQSVLKAQAPAFDPNINLATTNNIIAKDATTAKESTPIVSANCDAVEVTLPPKKDSARESPAKGGRKQAAKVEHQQQQHTGGKEGVTTCDIKDSSTVAKQQQQQQQQQSQQPKEVVAAPQPAVVKETVPTPQDNNSNNNRKLTQPRKDSNSSNVNISSNVSNSSSTSGKIASTDHKVPNIVDNNETLVVSSSVGATPPPQPTPSVTTQAAAPIDAAAKSKNASRERGPSKDTNQTVAPTKAAAAAPVAAVVPPPQPAKTTGNKTSKKSDLNQKGANKEGTDMDAFNDNNNAPTQVNRQDIDAVNANVVAETIIPTDEINANSLSKEQVTTLSAAATVEVKKNGPVVAAPVPEVAAKIVSKPLLPKTGGFNITDIVKEQPKPIKSFPVAPPPAQQNTGSDEPDRAVVLNNNDKLVQAKNEANAKDSGVTEAIKSALPYKDDQWTPHNQDGKKVYDRDFLMALRDNPASKRRPDNLPDIVLAEDRGRLSDGRYSMGGGGGGGGRTDFAPQFGNNYGGKSSSQRGAITKRGSQSGKPGGSGGGGGGGGGGSGAGKGSKSQIIKVSISVREDVKLHEVENAWKPARLNKGEVVTDEDQRTAVLYKKVRGVLNKLTPQKFETLLSQVRALEIDTADRLQGVIDLVFEKAVDEPSFSVAYALMCRELALMQVPAPGSTEEKKEVVNFRKLMITRCQMEFEKQSLDESDRNEKLKVITACTDADKKKELQFELEEYDRRLRMKSVGNIRFIGELFKQQMLTISIMMRCLDNLLENRDEESLECLCKLLTTIGHELESKKVDLSPIFGVMASIVADRKSSTKVSSRVRFMLQDVIDLRKSKWVPRRGDSNPKTIDQIQKEAENEHMNIQVMNSVPITPRKDDRGGGGGGGGAGGQSTDRRKKTLTEDGWQTTQSRNNRPSPFTVQSDKLKYKVPLNDEPLGSSRMFGNWSKGSNIKSDQVPATNTANMYAALENIDSEKRPPGSRPGSKDPYSSKGSSMERGSAPGPYNKNSYDGSRGGGSRSGSQHRSMDREPPMQRPSLPPHQAPPPQSAPKPVAVAAAVPAPTVAPAPAQSSSYITNEVALERHVKNNLDEYLNESLSVEEYSQDTLAVVPPGYYPRVVADGYLNVLERSATARLRTGKLFAKLIKIGTISVDDYCTGLEEVFSQVDDLRVDIPMIWSYLSELLVDLVCEGSLPLSRLYKSSEVLINQDHSAKLLSSLFKLVISEKGPNFLLDCWKTSGLSLDQFLGKSKIDGFVKENKLEFLLGGDTSVGQSQLTYEQIHDKLLNFFSLEKTIPDDVENWITANVGERSKEKRFIRTLATAIFEYSIHNHKLIIDNLVGNYRLLQKYVDANSAYELECLHALQALIHKLEHPKGVLLDICNRLYEDTLISQEGFVMWSNCKDPAEQEGKGVAAKQLTSFFTQLEENDDDVSEDEDCEQAA